jgi:Family of unknown function (DUF6152)
MNFKVRALVILGLLSMASAAWAHHNMSVMFDFNDRVTVTGTFTRFDWRNPHVELFVEAKGDLDQVLTWRLEGPSPNTFRNRVVTKEDFEKAFGKSMTVEVSRARDGSLRGLIRKVTMPDGKVMSLCPQEC